MITWGHEPGEKPRWERMVDHICSVVIIFVFLYIAVHVAVAVVNGAFEVMR